MGIILGIQRVLQSSETGLGTLGMSAREADSEPREAAIVSLLPTCLTIVVSILVTTYIASYGETHGIIAFPAEGIERLKGYFFTAQEIAGVFGLVVLCIFSLLSGLSVLLSSYYFLSTLFNGKENTNIIKGSVTAGKLADLVVPDSNPLKVDVTKLKDVAVLETIKEGKTIYTA